MDLKLVNAKDYTSERIQDIATLFDLYFKEVETDRYIGNINTVTVMIRDMLFNQNKSIYILYDEEKAIGFIELFINDQYGNTHPVIFVEYMYLLDDYRNGKAILHLYNMVGLVCKDTGYDGLASTMITSSNMRNNRLVGGEAIAETVRFPLDKINRKLEQYKKRL